MTPAIRYWDRRSAEQRHVANVPGALHYDIPFLHLTQRSDSWARAGRRSRHRERMPVTEDNTRRTAQMFLLCTYTGYR